MFDPYPFETIGYKSVSGCEDFVIYSNHSWENKKYNYKTVTLMNNLIRKKNRILRNFLLNNIF